MHPVRRLALRGAAALIALVAVAALPALAQVASPAVITLAPDCGDPLPGARYSITVTGANFNPATGVLVTFDSARGGTPETFQTRTDGFGRFTVVITPLRRALGIYQVRADDLRQREATAQFRVKCSDPPPVTDTTTSTSKVPDTTTSTTVVTTTTPTTVPVVPPVLRLEPPLGPPGFVSSAVGSGFPPGAPVTLTWSPGITAIPRSQLVADATGAFRTPMLVFNRDLIGPRRLTATPAGGAAFPAVSTPFLVVSGTLQPGDFKVRR
ncbi:MAG: hypothetical protein ACR2MO_02485 [Acidimicrobiales bacterium]